MGPDFECTFESTQQPRWRPAVTAMFHQIEAYSSPDWGTTLKVPARRMHLGIFPTPIHPWQPSGFSGLGSMLVKRDDLTGMQLSGNKVRKLEFLIADAKERGHDSVITIGGIQSNHCRATAVAARYAGLDCHLILRNSQHFADQDPGLVGNLLVERLVGCHVHQVTKEEYVRVGSVSLGLQLQKQLQAQGLNPVIVPVGGSSALGTWGYLQATAELAQQHQQHPFTDIILATGSGGTAAGLALGNHLGQHGWRIWAYGVCDDPDYFYAFMQNILDELGASIQDMITVRQAKGAGYAMSRTQELVYMQQIAQDTGIVLDPVYSGKALFCFAQEVRENPAAWEGRKVLFLHTGGLLGMYDKCAQLQPVVEGLGRSHRLQVG